MNKFIINEEEKRRILMMHQSATKKQYLNEKQDAIKIRDLTKDDIQDAYFSDGNPDFVDNLQKYCEIVNNNTVIFNYNEKVNFYEGDRIVLGVTLNNFAILKEISETKNTQGLEYSVNTFISEETFDKEGVFISPVGCTLRIEFKIPKQSIYNNVFAREYNYPTVEVPCENTQGGKLKLTLILPKDATVLTIP